MLTVDSVGQDWILARPNERRAYVETACLACADAQDLRKVSSALVLEGVTTFFMQPKNLRCRVSSGFAAIFIAIRDHGDYRASSSKTSPPLDHAAMHPAVAAAGSQVRC